MGKHSPRIVGERTKGIIMRSFLNEAEDVILLVIFILVIIVSFAG